MSNNRDGSDMRHHRAMSEPQSYVSAKRPMGAINQNEAMVFSYPGYTQVLAVKLL